MSDIIFWHSFYYRYLHYLLGFQGLLAPVLSGLPVGVEDMFSVDWDDSMAGSHPPAAYWEASKELRLHLNFLLLLLLLQHDSKEVVRTITRSKVGGKPLGKS